MSGQNAQRTGRVITNLGGPIIITGQLRNTSVREEDGRTALYTSAEGEWPRTYQWERNGEPIEGATQPSLTIENATSKDSGLYRVTITNKHGSVTSDEAVLKVVSPGAPQIFADGKEVVGSVVKGDKAEITLSTSFEDGTILYTLDGSEPSFDSTLYDESFTVSKTTGIRAIAYSKDFSDLAEVDPVFINIVPNYDLNVSIQGQGTVVKDPADGPYIQDSVAKLKAVPEEGWRFTGWSGALKSSFEEGSVVMSTNKALTALFEPIPTFKLDIKSTGGGQIKGTNKNRLTLMNGGSFEFEFDLNEDGTIAEQPFPSSLEAFLFEDEYLIPDNGRVRIEIFHGSKTVPIENVTLPLDGPYFGLQFAENIWPSGKGKVVIINLGDPFQIHSIKIVSHDRALDKRDFPLAFQQNSKVDLNANIYNGFEFLGWSGDATGTNPELTLTMDRDKTVEAVFGTDLATTATGKGKLIIDPPTGPYPYGTKVNITPVPDSGYYLGIWGGDAKGMEKGPIEYEITKANPEITALFVPLKENRFTITTLASSGGSVVSNPNSNAYVNGQQVTLTATPEPGYSFVGWTGDIESTVNPLVTLADANKTVTAQFRRNIIAPVTLTINAENGTVTRTPSDELYEKGTNVELLAQANAGYTFTGWAGALGGSASRVTLFLDGDKEVTANFKASYQLATETRGPGGVLTTPSSTTFIDGDEVILTASPGEGYGFVGWSGDL
ncbi:MAG: chitobiase/beta-hexosaminidase C-terminal domain-containing protein, partial [Candidatus Poribacteria bacterium]|nr:chitobiase/beta-hexosaminidase C-terminal domain-containing protein [Candidatus Poribacteria bacterium]